MKAQEELCVALAKQSSIGVRLRRNEVDTLRLAAERKGVSFFISRRWLLKSKEGFMPISIGVSNLYLCQKKSAPPS
jgi:hypothetical protein